MFTDDSEPLPQSDCVHCVFCGASIPLPRAHAAEELPPFSNRVERDADFALGVLGSAGAGFPDTLRQFRVRQPPLPRITTETGDSLAPLADDTELPPRDAVAPTRWWGVSFWASLGAGFAVGGLLAYGAALSWRAPETAVVVAVPASAPVNAGSVTARAAAAAPAPALTAPSAPTAALQVAGAAPSPKPPRVFDATAERRFALERARAEQRRYHLQEAERLYRQVLAHSPRDSEALAGLGELELLRGTTDLAEARFQQALDANQDYVPARIAVADLQWQAGHVEAARQAYRDIVEHYAGDLYPPYVSQRSSVGEPPQCDK